jgi:hypothetical protein
VQPMLGELALPHVQEISGHDRRALAEHKPPGMDGSLLQNLGRRPARLVVRGVATGADAASFVERLDGQFRAGAPLSFVTDIVADAQIDQVVIDDLHVDEGAGRPQLYEYVLTLVERIEPAQPEDAALLDQDILDDATDLVDGLIDGLDVAVEFATGLERFATSLTDVLERLRQFREAVEHRTP